MKMLSRSIRTRRLLPAMAGLGLLAVAAPASASTIGFEPNRGQTDPEVRFISRGRGYVLFLTSREVVLALGTEPGPLRMRLAGARPAATSGEGARPGKSHYFLGNDPAGWRLDVPSYERVRYEEVYPGVDLLFYGNRGELEYDFVVSPGRDPRRIELELSGARALSLDGEGNLVLTVEGGILLWRKPVAYQVDGGVRHEVASRYVRRGGRRVGFEVARYDPTRPLVIDPTLSYSTYLGGGGADSGHAITVDAAGNAYVTGETASINFPGTGTLQGTVDAFVTKFNSSGTTRLYSVYLGGTGLDVAWGIAVDAAGNAYVAGETDSPAFPTTTGAFQTVKSTGRDAFVTRLNAAGVITYSTYLGGSGMEGDRANGVAVDPTGNVVVAGRTNSMDFPTTAGALFPSFRGGPEFDAFVSKLNPAASGPAALVYSTYLGGSGNDAAFGVALDSAGNPHVAGGTGSSDFPASAGAYQGSNTASSTDAFFTKLNPTATGILYSTFLGGSGSFERANGIGLDASGHAVITGQTTSSDFPTKNPLQTYQGGPNDAFVAKFDPSASGNASLLYSTFLGGTGNDTGRAIAVDASGRVYVTGQTASGADFPIDNAVQATYGGDPYDAFVTKLNAAGTARLYSTYLGGSDAEGTAATLQGGHGIAVSPCGDAWVTGRTVSPNFPTVSPAQPTPGGLADAFVARISDPDPPTITGVVPQWGPVSGSAVTIVGNCFRPGATATFGGTAATGLAVVSPTALTATTPAHAAGAVDVAVTNPGSPPVTRVGAFTYGATGFFSVAPCRIVDTRNAAGALGGPALAANTDRTFAVTGACGIPATAGAISVNLTVTQPSAVGDLRLYPGGTSLPPASSINYAAGQTRANNATVLLGPGGTVSVRCVQASGNVHFLLDVNGYYR